MHLFRIHAYEVTPQRLSNATTAPRGGAFSADAAFKKSLQAFLENSQLTTQPTVDFRVPNRDANGTTPANVVRSHLLDYCFGAPATAKSSAIALATKLGESMDNRSPFTLLTLSAYRDGHTRRLVFWAFPKDEPFHFSASGGRAKIKILKDAFSRSSSFRKAALFEGVKSDATFWNGRVIDKQAQGGFGTAADYWVTRFLECRFSLTGKAGTRLLAKCLRETHSALAIQSDRDQISKSVVAVHASQRLRWSMQRFAHEYLTDGAKKVFLQSVPAEARSTTFSLDKSELEKKLNIRVFRLKDDVIVSAPFGTVGNSVVIDEQKQKRRLRCEGDIVDEKVRARHA